MSYPEESLLDLLNDGWSRMSNAQRFLWDASKRSPEEWELENYGNCWVVALMGNFVIYYNHFECGFELSRWSKYGSLEYQANQWSLEEAVQQLLNLVSHGYYPRISSGPIPGSY